MNEQTSTIYSVEPDTDTLGGRISRARYATGMSSAQLARRIGVRSATLQGWESDRAEPRANRLQMLAGILGVSLSWLLSGVGAAPPDEPEDNAVRLALGQLDRAKRLHAEIGDIIVRVERELARVAAQDA